MAADTDVIFEKFNDVDLKSIPIFVFWHLFSSN